MSIFIYNSLTKKKEELIPLKDNVINMYSCGVTVYDKCHIGHARSLYLFDMITKYLRYRGYEVRFVRNITDVDDKIINKALEQKRSFEEVVRENIELYEKDLQGLMIDRADLEPRATENIAGMIDHINELIKQDYAYEVDGNVYFKVRSFKDYGKLSGQSVEKMLEAVRIDQDLQKQDPLDFALWKRSKEGEPAWESPWGLGRPGWHIECSVMSLKHLKTQSLDIHAGGRDLIFPHHENEIAQAEALTGQTFARYWIHHGLLTIEGQKMSKSLGNFITVQDAIRQYGVNDIKLFFLTSHYASAIDFNDAKLQDTGKALMRFSIFFQKARNVLKQEAPAEDAATSDGVQAAQKEFFQAMDDDFNTPRAFAVLFDLLSEANKNLDKPQKSSEDLAYVRAALDFIHDVLKRIFSVDFPAETEQLAPEEQQWLDERQQARLQKDYKRSDELRDLLKAKGIIVEDGREGQTWRRE